MNNESRFMTRMQAELPTQIVFDIIIPVWNQWELTVACLRSIKKYSQQYRLIVINNGSEAAEWSRIEQELSQHRNVLVITNAENVGFVKAVNQGIGKVEAPFTVLMNNDTEAVYFWLQKLKTPLVVNNRIMLSGPLTTTPDSWQGKYPKNRAGWTVRESGMLAFFCTMFRSEVFKTVGLLDEAFGVGFGDDDDYCLRVLKAGYKMALVQDIVIPHHHRSTFKKLYSDETISEMQKTAINRFYEKHNIQKK
jgi:GT2 family glycosyltransferase